MPATDAIRDQEYAADDITIDEDVLDAAGLYLRDLGLVAHNMVPSSSREACAPRVSYFGEFRGDFAAFECVVTLNAPADMKLHNGRWHEGEGYDLEWLSLVPREVGDDGEVYTKHETLVTTPDGTRVILQVRIIFDE